MSLIMMPCSIQGATAPPLWDLTNDAASITLIEDFVKSDKPVGAVCHATAALLNAKSESGEPIVKKQSDYRL